MNEIWKDVTGFEGFYKVSNFGHVKSLGRDIISKTGNYYKPEKILTLNGNDGKGYVRVVLHANKKIRACRIHRLVAEAFIINPYNKCDINHIDGDKANNNIKNLEWATRSENELHSHRILGKIIGNIRPIICIETNKIYPSISQAAREENLNMRVLWNVLNGIKNKTYKKQHWKYADES